MNFEQAGFQFSSLIVDYRELLALIRTCLIIKFNRNQAAYRVQWNINHLETYTSTRVPYQREIPLGTETLSALA